MTTKIAIIGVLTTTLSLLLTFCFYWQNCTDLLCLSNISSTDHKGLLWGTFVLNFYLLFFFGLVLFREKKGYFFWKTKNNNHNILDDKEEIIIPKATSINLAKYDFEYDMVRTISVLAIMISVGLLIISIFLCRYWSINHSFFSSISPLFCYISMGVLQFVMSLWITLSGFPLNNPYPYRVHYEIEP